MKKHNLLVFTIILLILPFTISAQYSTSSPYSRFGIGEINRDGFARNHAMGGTGIGLRSPDFLNNINPASTSAMLLSEIIFDVGVMSKFSMLSTSEQEQFNKDFNLSYFALGIPIKKWWATSIGITPYSSIGYEINDNQNISDTHLLDFTYKGTGGINRVYFNNAFKVQIDSSQNISVGATTSFLFGSINQSVEQIYIEQNLLYYGETDYTSMTQIDRNLIVQDFALTLGMQYTKYFKNKYRLVIGATLDNENSIHARRNQTVFNTHNYLALTNTVEVANDTLEVGEMLIPKTIGFGFSFSSKKIIIAADYKAQNWSEATFFDANDLNLSNSRTFSGGMEYRPSLAAQNYWKRVRYRFGARYTDTHLIFDDNQLKDMSLSFGLSLPLRKNYSLINLSFEVGQMGTTDNNLIKEQYGIMTLNFTLHDRWFVKRKFD